MDTEIWPSFYVPFHQSPDNAFSLIVRTADSPYRVIPALSSLIRKIDPEIALHDESSMEFKIQHSPSAYLQRSSASLLIAFASFALLLSIVGLYGVVSYSVEQRTREIGIRMALGAESKMVTQMVLREAGVLSAYGIIVGAVASLGLSQFLDKLLFHVKPSDPATLLAVVFVLATCTIFASLLPARRAAHVNPVDSLRAD